MTLAEKVKNAGVVGAGGAGFPTHVKLGSKAEWFLANGAECEPLMHKDRELMIHFAKEIVQGLKLSAQAVQASKIAVGVKSKNQKAISALEQVIPDQNIQIKQFGDYYPVGDEYELVYGITGRLIPPQGLPIEIGVVVNNVETLYNIYQADHDIPVTHTFMTIAGLVNEPKTMWVPVGMPVQDVLDLAGGSTTGAFAVMESGLMMGELVRDLAQPITKTTGGLIVLPKDHDLISRYSKTQRQMDRIGHSACDQCTYCTEFCPRFLLGYEIEPHKVMRALGFSDIGSDLWNKYALLCCKCGICTLYACPEALYPREACMKGIEDLKKIDKGKWQGDKNVTVHPMREGRRLPLKMLMRRLGVIQYEAEAAYDDTKVNPKIVTIPLQQHIGAPAEPVVKAGETVQKGQAIARPPQDQLGSPIHSSIDGSVQEIKNKMVVIKG